ncbi:hypothetical protein [Flavobacterium sp.]|uniref:hypothetical protein n=1 Tax=Flavobacterium sp. TaxID=239 RepID=UPI003C50FF19
MKKITLLISLLILNFSCTPEKAIATEEPKTEITSTETPTTENQSNDILVSYYTVSDGNRLYEHFFEDNGNRYQKIVSPDGQIYVDFKYDSANKMTSISYTNGAKRDYYFYYNTKGQIEKIKQEGETNTFTNGVYSTTITTQEWDITYDGNTILKTLKNDLYPFSKTITKYTLNDKGLITIIHNYVENTRTPAYSRTVSYLTLKYDTNKNLITFKATDKATHDLPDSPDPNYTNTGIVYFEYDTNPNPIYPIYMNHYLNYSLIDVYPFSYSIKSDQDRMLWTGYNNLKKTIYDFELTTTPVGNPIIKYTNIYEYDPTNNKPTRMSTRSTTDNKEYSFIKYNYRAK